MGLLEKFKTFVSAEEEYEDDEDFEYEEPEVRPAYSSPPRASRSGYGLSPNTDTLPPRRERQEPLGRERERERERERDFYRESKNVIPLRGSKMIEEITARFNIMVIEPKAFDECPQLVDSLKNRMPVIINLENIENDTARKIFDFLSGATYALNGNVQKIAQNIFVFLPENVDVQTSAEPREFKYGESKADHWK